MKELVLSTRNIMRNPLRSLSTALSLILGYLGLVSVIGYNERWTETLSVSSQFFQYKGTVSIMREGAIARLPYTDESTTFAQSKAEKLKESLLTDARVVHVSQGLYGTGLVSNGCETAPFVGLGVSLETQSWMMKREDVRFWGRDLLAGQQGEHLFESTSSLPGAISYGLAERLSKPVIFSEMDTNHSFLDTVDCDDEASVNHSRRGSDLQLLSKSFERRIGAVDMDVVNHFTTGMAHLDDKSVLMPIETFQSLFETERVSFVSVYLADRGERRAFIDDWSAHLSELGLVAYAYDDPLLSPFDAGIMNFLKVMGLFFVGLIAFVVALAITNAVSLTFLDRQTEIGTLRAIGFSNHDLARQLTLEVLILGALSLGLAFLLQIGLEALVNTLDIRFRPPGFARTVQFLIMPSLLTRFGATFALLALIVSASYLSVRVHCRKKTVELLNPSSH